MRRKRRRKQSSRFLAVLLTVAMVITMCPVDQAWAAGGTLAGSGTESDPYLIEDAQDLASLGGTSLSDKYYKVTNEIDMSGVTMTPIKELRSGTFDGGGFAIKNLNISCTSGSAGLFAQLGYDSIVKGVILENLTVTSSASGYDYGTGGLVGAVKGASTITNCGITGSSSVTNTLASYSVVYAGGLIGSISEDAVIDNCFSTASVTALSTNSSSRVGGFVGSISYCNVNITNCYTTGDVSAKKAYTGGFIGYLSCGYSSNDTFENCFSAGTVTAPETSNCNAFAYISSSSGYNFTNCYFDSDKTSQNGTNKDNANENVVGKSTAELKNLAATLGSSFQADLTPPVNGGYPILKWQDPNATYNVTLSVTPQNAKVTIDGVVQDTSENGLYDLGAKMSGTQITYKVEQADDSTDYAPKEGTITVGKSNVELNVQLVPNQYELVLEVAPAEAKLTVKDSSGNPRTFAERADVTTGGSVTGKSYKYIVESGDYTYAADYFGYESIVDKHLTINKAGRTVTVSLEKKPVYTVTFEYAGKDADTIQNGSLKVTTEDGQEMSPVSEGGVTYELPVGSTYEYKFKSANYSSITKKIDLTGETAEGKKTVTIALAEKTAWEGAEDILQPECDANGVYQIGSGAELAWFAEQVNNGEGKTYDAVLIKKIDLGNQPWTPIGKSGYNYEYEGTFDGAGWSIEGLNVISDKADQGLFGYISGATIKNLKVHGSVTSTSTSSSGGVGGIVGTMYANYSAETIVENCISYVTVSGGNNVGGIAGYCTGGYSSSSATTIQNCVNRGTVTGNNSVGGIAGNLSRANEVKNCYNRGEITANVSKAGGIAGYLSYADASVADCYTTGSVSKKGDSHPAIGKKENGSTVTNCYFLDALGSDSNAIAISDSDLKALKFKIPIEAFSKDMVSDKANDGYPILPFQDTTQKYEVKLTVNPPEVAHEAEVVLTDSEGTQFAGKTESNVWTYNLPDGEYTYEITAFGKITQTKTFTVDGSAIAEEITLVDSPRKNISFSIKYEDNNPAATASVEVKNFAGTIMEAETGIYKLPYGEYTYTIKARGYAKQEASFTVDDSHSGTVDIRMMVSTAWDGETLSQPAGSGTEESPYEISTGEELAWFAKQVNSGSGKNYKAQLAGDIDLGNNPWTPIGNSYSHPFSGTFDGNGYTISGLLVENVDYAGLIGHAMDATIQNLVVAGVVSGTQYTGGVIGTANGRVTIHNCGSEVNVTGTGNWTGGIVGRTYGYDNNVSGCYNVGTINEASDYAGGIVGKNDDGSTITDCYNANDVKGKNAGGICGNSESLASCINCYNTGKVSGTNTGAIWPGSYGTTENCYYLEGGSDLHNNAVSQNSAQLQNLTDTLNGNRDPKVWKSVAGVNEGYPVLAWQKADPPAEAQPLAAVQNVQWECAPEVYVNPETLEEVSIHEPIIKWEEVAHASSYTAVLWKEGFVWEELSEEEKKAFDEETDAIKRLMMIDEQEIVKKMTPDEAKEYDKYCAAVEDARLQGSNTEAAERARADFLLSFINDETRQIKLGNYVPGVEKVTAVEGIKKTCYDFTAIISNKGEGRYYVTVTPIANDGSGYLSGEVPERMTADNLADLNDENIHACYNHLRQPVNLKWDGTVASWSGSENAEYYSVILYSVSDTEEKPVYTKLQEVLVDAPYTWLDCDRYFTANGRYAFTVRAEAGAEGMFAGFTASDVSAYSPDYKVGEVEIPGDNQDRPEDWIPISSAKEWIALANVEDKLVSDTDQTSQQTQEWSKKYYLTADLDFSKLSAADQAKTKSIGNKTNHFRGTMDGNGHKITGLTLSDNDSGLFKYIGASGLVYDLTIENANVLFSDNAAVLAENNYGTISDCAVINCNITADIGAVLGGMVSRNYGKIQKSYVEGGTLKSNSTTATGHAGFVGSNENGTIEKCWTSMKVDTQSDYAGGFIGLGYGGTIRDCFALGDVNARGYSGGFMGRQVYEGNIIENCYAAGKLTITETGTGHGFIGTNKPDSLFQLDQWEGLSNCYYNSKSPEEPQGAEGKTLSEMKEDAFLSALNKTGFWAQNATKNNGLPYLRDVKAPENIATEEITVQIAIAKYNKETYEFSKLGDIIEVKTDSNGNTRVTDLMDSAQDQGKLTYSYETTPAYGRFIHAINGYEVDSPDGWMFTINDKLSNVSASLATVKDGDQLLWYEGTTENLFKGPTWTALTEGEMIQWIDIDSVEKLQKLAASSDAEELGKNYRLTCDLDLKDINFAGIGSVDHPFTGMFDGQNHTISNVTITGTKDGTGFFNAIQDATVKNLNLKNVEVQGTNLVGGMVGVALAKLDQNDLAKNEANLIGNCSVSGTVTATGENPGCAGGLVGKNCKDYDKDTQFSISSAIDKCSADVAITATNKVGGLVGENDGTITKSAATGAVNGETTVGGLVGDNVGDIYDCHAEGSVTGSNVTGGFAGYSDGIVKNCYSTGNVTGTDNTGSFAGSISKADYVIGAGTVTIKDQPSTTGYNGGFAGNLGGTLAGTQNQVTIIDAYGNTVGLENVVGNSSSFTSSSEMEKLQEMKLDKLSDVADKLYEMFGVNLPSSLQDEAKKYLDKVTAGSEVAQGDAISCLKDGEKPDAGVAVTYTVDEAGKDYLNGGEALTLVKANDTAATLTIPVVMKLSSGEDIYNKELSVVLPVSADKRTELMDTIAAGYTGISDSWTVMDMAVYNTLNGKTSKTSDEALQNMINLGITEAAGSKATASDRARLEIALRSVGIDTTKLYQANDAKAIDNAAKLKGMDLNAGGYYAAPWILLADLQGNVKLSDGQVQSLIKTLKDNMGDGLFGYQWDGVTYSDPDTAGAALAALAKYYNTNTDAKAVVDQILKALPGAMDENGSFGNANSDAMVILGLLAMGHNPAELKTEGGVSVVDGLLSYVNSTNNGFRYFDDEKNALATEQGFRALVALAKYDGQNPYNVYDFSKNQVAAGHATGAGEVEVPENPPAENGDINVTVTIQTDTTTWMDQKTVTVKKGSTVYHAFTKALEGSGITQVGAEKGYVKSMTKDGVTLAEFTKGQNSGWLYKVNGTLPNVALTSYKISNGDQILWYYTVDYVKDPSAGSWETPQQPVTQDVTATVNKDNEATSKLTSSDVDKLVDAAVKNSAATVEVNVKGADKADKVTVELPKASVSNIANKTDAALQVTTPAGTVTMDKQAMKEAVKAASGSDLTIVLDKQDIADASKEPLGSTAAQTKVSILSDGKEIKDLGTAKVKILLPISDAMKDKAMAAATVDEDGKLTKTDGKLVTVNGKTYYQIETSKPGAFVVAESANLDAAIKAQAAETDDEKLARIIKGVQDTTIKITKTSKGKGWIKINWRKSKGYKVDYYEVFRKTGKNSKFGKTAFYKTKKNGLTGYYKNTKALKKGKRYYYKVRGVRVIDGKKYYTKWSNTRYRIAK